MLIPPPQPPDRTARAHAPLSLPFANRQQAGRLLAQRLRHLTAYAPLILALPRGGVPVAAEVAAALHAPLDLLLVRKIGVPGQPELALAAVVEGDPAQLVVDRPVQAALGISQAEIEAYAQPELAENARRRAVYLRGRAPLSVQGRTVVVVDDGIATGTTMRAALASLRQRGATRVVLAVPVAPPDVLLTLGRQVDELVCLATPQPLDAVGAHYADFHQVPDAEVLELLDAAACTDADGQSRSAAPPAPD